MQDEIKDSRTRQHEWRKAHRPHLAAAIVGAVLGLPLLWFLLAYAGLPHLWSHHEHRKGKLEGVLVSYTPQDIPGDPINVEVFGPLSSIDCAYRAAGWSKADNVSLVSGLRIGESVLLSQPYPNAPVSPLFVDDRQQDVAYEIDEGKSADKRHHIRFWQISPGRWLASGTFDRGVGLSLFTLQITHHIGPDVDRERDIAAGVLMHGGAVPQPSVMAGKSFGRVHRNGGGDKYMFDGRVAVMKLPQACPAGTPAAS